MQVVDDAFGIIVTAAGPGELGRVKPGPVHDRDIPRSRQIQSAPAARTAWR